MEKPARNDEGGEGLASTTLPPHPRCRRLTEPASESEFSTTPPQSSEARDPKPRSVVTPDKDKLPSGTLRQDGAPRSHRDGRNKTKLEKASTTTPRSSVSTGGSSLARDSEPTPPKPRNVLTPDKDELLSGPLDKDAPPIGRRKSKLEKITELKMLHREARDANKALILQLRDAESRTSSIARKLLSKIQDERTRAEQLERKVSEGALENEGLRQELDEALDDVEQLEEEQDDDQALIDKLDRELAKLSEDTTKADEEVARLTGELQAKDAELLRKNAEIDYLRARLEEAEATVATMDDLNGRGQSSDRGKTHGRRLQSKGKEIDEFVMRSKRQNSVHRWQHL